MKYITTPLEDLVEELYEEIGVMDPNYPIEGIADKLGIYLSYFRLPLPFTIPGNIVLNPFHSKEKQKETFAHELNHNLHHAGVQLNMPEQFRLMQEHKAHNFAYHFAVPTFMLRKMRLPKYRNQAVDFIAKNFGVTHAFADKRLEHYERQVSWFRCLYINKPKRNEYVSEEIDLYGDLPFYETPDFKEFEKEIRRNGATDRDISLIIEDIRHKSSRF